MENYSCPKRIRQSRAVSKTVTKEYTLFAAGDLSNLPAVPKYYSSSSTEIRVYESLLNSRGAIRVSETNLLMLVP